MKPLMAVIFAATLVACEETRSPMTSTGIPNRPYAAYDTGRFDYSPQNSPFRRWTTAQLQDRRRDLYATVPYRQSRHGTPIYEYQGQPLPQQDELFAIETELNRRYQAGDKSAELIRPIPGTTHI
jgi:hypothetical protein